MSDYDERGAYSPRNEEPLSFDPRRPGGGGGRAPTTLILSAAVLLLLAAGVFFYYRSGVRREGEAPRVLGKPVGEIASAPAASAQPSDTAEGLQVYTTEDQGSDASPTLAPAPEQPMARPAPPPPPVRVLRPAPPPRQAAPLVRTPAPAPAPKVTPAPAPAARVQPSPVKVAPTAPQTVPPAAPLARKQPAAKAPSTDDDDAIGALLARRGRTAEVSPATTSTEAATGHAASGGGAVVQIGAFSNTAQADKGWSDVAKAVPGQMSGKGKRVETAQVSGKTFQRAYVTGFGSKASAQAFCAKLKSAGHSCIVR